MRHERTDRPDAKKIIDTIAEAMREGVEPVDKECILVPASYEVLLHADAVEELTPILPYIRERAIVRLDRELERLNEGSVFAKAKRWVEGSDRRAPYRRAGRSWEIEMYAAHDPDAGTDYIAVAADLTPTHAGGDIAGPKTRRLTVRDSASGGYRTRTVPVGTTGVFPSATRDATAGQKTQRTVLPAGTGGPPDDALARLTRQDKPERPFLMKETEIAVGRADEGYEWVQVQIDAPDDVSREHLRLRCDPDTGTFFIKDLSTFGTTIGAFGSTTHKRTVASSIDRETDRDLDRWEELPERASIGLAGVVFLDFESLR